MKTKTEWFYNAHDKILIFLSDKFDMDNVKSICQDITDNTVYEKYQVYDTEKRESSYILFQVIKETEKRGLILTFHSKYEDTMQFFTDHV